MATSAFTMEASSPSAGISRMKDRSIFKLWIGRRLR